MQFLVENCGLKDNKYQYWQLSVLASIKNRKENIATIEFTTLGLCKVQNLIKIGRFAIFRPKLWQIRSLVPISTDLNIDRHQESQKNWSLLISGLSICVEFQISSKLKILQLLLKIIVTIEFTNLRNYGLKDDSANIDKCQIWQGWESQKTIVTIEFTTLILCRVQNFIKIEAFVALRPKLPKLWPNRWQVHRLTSVNIDRRQKLEKKCCHHWIHCPRFVQSMKFL